MKTLLFLLLSVSAATAQWQRMPGPYGAIDLNGFASIGTNLFASAGGDIYRSVDSGARWSLIAHWPLAPNGASSLFFSHDTTLFVISGYGALYRSRDLGAGWDSLTNPIYQGTTIYTTPRGLFTWTGTGLTFDTLMFSSDDGTTWQFQSLPWMEYPGAIVTAGTATLMIGDYGISRSTDSGKTWDSSLNVGCEMLFANDSLVLAVAGGGHSGGSVYSSTDAGITWSATSLRFAEDLDYAGGFQMIGDQLFVADANQNKVYASSDKGHSWHVRYNSFGPQTALFAFGNDLYIGGGHSPIFGDASYLIYRSRDSAKTWSMSNIGLPNTTVYALAANSTAMFAAVDEALEMSTNDGQTWSVVRYFPDKKVCFLRVRDSVVIIGGGVLGSGSLGQPIDTLFYSTDNGKTFQTNDLAASRNYGLALLDTIVLVATPPGLLVSHDNGKDFVLLDSEFQYVYDPVVVGNNIFVSKQGGQIYVASDLGLTWSESLSDSSLYGSTLNSVDGLLFVSMPFQRIQRSTDTGRTWSQIATLSDQLQIGPMVDTFGYLFASLTSSDSAEQHYYSFVSISSNGGSSWYSIPVGYPDLAERPNTLLIHDGYLFAGGPGGLWRRPLAEMMPIPSGVFQAPLTSTTSIAINPNPVRDALTITFVNSPCIAHYEVTDALGRAVIEGSTSEGTLYLSAAELPSGIYTFRTDSNGFVQSRRFVVMR